MSNKKRPKNRKPGVIPGTWAANQLVREVMKKLGVTDRNKIQCPRESSAMTPCIARDGATALADHGVCVGCGADPKALLKVFGK